MTLYASIMPDLSVIIVNWNRSDLLVGCLKSVQERTHCVSYEIFVVDNASTDDSVERVQADFPEVRLIRNQTNRGFAVANNQALRLAQGRYCLLLNNDTEVLEGCLDTMVAFMDRRPEVGALTCKQYVPAGPMDLPLSPALTDRGSRITPHLRAMPPCATAFPSPKTLLLKRLVDLFRLPQRFPQRRWWRRWTYLGEDPDREQEAAHITGSCFLIRRDAMQQVGLLDERFYFYLEETDWCWRLRAQGWKIYYTPEAAFLHYLSASGQLRTDREQLYYHSYCQFFEKHYGRLARWMYQLEKGVFNLLKRGGAG